jgi:RNA polymerase sigma factor (sigma-70 family)
LDDPKQVWFERDIELTDLLARVALQDRRSFAQLYRLTAQHLFSILLRIVRRRHLAEEVLQEVFVNVWRRAESYQRTKSPPMVWLSSVARNAAFDALRRQPAEEVDIDVAGLPEEPDSSAGPLELLIAGAEARRVRECLASLSGLQQQILALAFFHGLSHSEVSAHLGQPLGTIKTRLRRGLQAIKSCLTK